jgi:hypothetical protein
MITGLDHVVVLLADIKAGAKAYELLLGRRRGEARATAPRPCCLRSTT